jgi:hypothetical protein
MRKILFLALTLLSPFSSFAQSSDIIVNINTTNGYGGSKNQSLDARLLKTGEKVFSGNAINFKDSCSDHKFPQLVGNITTNPGILNGITVCESFDCFDCFNNLGVILFNNSTLCKSFVSKLANGQTKIILTATKSPYSTSEIGSGKGRSCAGYKEEVLNILDVR